MNPRMDVKERVHALLFDEFRTFIDLWGVEQGHAFEEMQTQKWEKRYPLFAEEEGLTIAQAYHCYQMIKECEEEERKEREALLTQ